jgi:hypothetical protein
MTIYLIVSVIVLALGIGVGFLIWGRKRENTVLGKLIQGLTLQQRFFLAFTIIAAGFVAAALKTDFTGSAGPYKMILVLVSLGLFFAGFVLLNNIHEKSVARATVTTRRRRKP